MKPVILLALLCFLTINLLAQQNHDCDLQNYKRLIKESEELTYGKNGRKTDYKLAIDKLFSARTCQPDSEAVVNKRLLLVFDEVNRQKELAVSNAEEAKRQTKKAIEQRDRADDQSRSSQNNSIAIKTEKINPTLALRIAEYNLLNHPEDVNAASTFNEILSNQDNNFYRGVYYKNNINALETYKNFDKILTAGDGLTAWNTNNDSFYTIIVDKFKVNSVKSSPKGELIFAGLEDGVVLTISSSFKVLHYWKAHIGGVRSVDISGDGRHLLTTGDDGNTIIWDTSGLEVKRMPTHSGGVSKAVFTKFGNLILSGGKEDGLINVCNFNGELVSSIDVKSKIIDFASLQPRYWEVLVLKDGGAQIYKFNGDLVKMMGQKIFYPEKSSCTSTSSGDTLIVYDAGSSEIVFYNYYNEELKKIYTPTVAFLKTTLCFSPNGHNLVAGSGDRCYVWDIKNQLIEKTSSANFSVIELAATTDGKYFITGRTDGCADIIGNDGKLCGQLKGHTDWIKSIGVSPDRSKIVTGGFDGFIKIWTFAGKLIVNKKAHNGRVLDISVAGDGSFFVTGGADGIAKKWDWKGNILMEINGHLGSVLSVDVSLNGKTIATGCGDNVVRIWTAEGTLIKKMTGHLDGITALAFSPNGKFLVSGSWDKTIRYWSIADGSCKIFTGSNDGIFSLDVSRDSKYIISSTGGSAFTDNAVRIWNPSGTIIKEISIGISPAIAVNFISNENAFVFANGFNNIVIGKITNDEVQYSLFPFYSELSPVKSQMSIALSPDNKLIGEGYIDGSVIIRNINGGIITEMHNDSNSIFALAFSPDSRSIISTCSGNRIACWSIQGVKIWEKETGLSTINKIKFFNNGNKILIADSEYNIQIYSKDGNLLKKIGQSDLGVSGSFSNVSFPLDVASDGKETIAFGITASRTTDGKFVSGVFLLDVLKNKSTFFELGISTGDNQNITSILLDEDKVITGYNDSQIRVFDIYGTLLKNFRVHQKPVDNIQKSSKNLYVSASNAENVCLWNLDGSVIQTFSGYQKLFGDHGLSVTNNLIGLVDGTSKVYLSTSSLLKEKVQYFTLATLLRTGVLLEAEDLKTLKSSRNFYDIEASLDYLIKNKNWQEALNTAESLIKMGYDDYTLTNKFLHIISSGGIEINNALISTIAKSKDAFLMEKTANYLYEKKSYTPARVLFEACFNAKPDYRVLISMQKLYALLKLNFDNFIGTLEKKNVKEINLELLKFYRNAANLTKSFEILQVLLSDPTDFEIKVESYSYYEESGDDIFEYLFDWKSTDNINDFLTYISNNRLGLDNNANEKIYALCTRLCDKLLSIEKNQTNLTIAAQWYTNHAWSYILQQAPDEAEILLKKALKVDPGYVYAIGNMPHIYLLQKKYDKAKEEYKRLKKENFDPKQGLPKFKDVFLSDFQAFKKENFYDPVMDEIEMMLNQN